MNQNDNAWKLIFDKYDIINEIDRNGYAIISANQIREYREPRLMTKFDHKVNLPKIFSYNNLSILPISRGDYIISTFSAYHNFEKLSNNIERFSVPHHIQTLSQEFIINESIALHCAYASKIIEDFLEEDELVSTISGRMGSGIFNFFINTSIGEKDIQVNNSQIEIDASFEGINCLSLFEAKMVLSDDFLIRQLYYPFRVWSNRLTKQVNTIFLIFSNGIFNMYKYQFEDPYKYNSIKLIKQKNYYIDYEISISDIEKILLNSTIVNESKDIPFPQADNMNRIINLIELLNESPMHKQDITSKYEFDVRQTEYYTDAGIYLNFMEKHIDNCDGDILFSLSELGNQIMKLSYRNRQLEIVKQILAHNVFNEVLKIHLQTGEMPSKKIIHQIMVRSNLTNISAESTYLRRARTVSSWINWILGIIEFE